MLILSPVWGVFDLRLYCSRGKGPAGCVFHRPSLGWDCGLKARVGGHAICEFRVFHIRRGIIFSAFYLKNILEFVGAFEGKVLFSSRCLKGFSPRITVSFFAKSVFPQVKFAITKL